MSIRIEMKESSKNIQRKKKVASPVLTVMVDHKRMVVEEQRNWMRPLILRKIILNVRGLSRTKNTQSSSHDGIVVQK